MPPVPIEAVQQYQQQDGYGTNNENNNTVQPQVYAPPQIRPTGFVMPEQVYAEPVYPEVGLGYPSYQQDYPQDFTVGHQHDFTAGYQQQGVHPDYQLHQRMHQQQIHQQMLMAQLHQQELLQQQLYQQLLHQNQQHMGPPMPLEVVNNAHDFPLLTNSWLSNFIDLD